MKISSIKKVKENPDIFEVTYIEDYFIFKPKPKTKLIYKDNSFMDVWKFLYNDDYVHDGITSKNITIITKHLKLNEEFKVY